MERAELEATCKEAVGYIGIDGIVSNLIDWAEKAFYQTIAEGIMDDMATAMAVEAAKVGKVG